MSASAPHKGVPPLLHVTFPGPSGQSQSHRFRLSFRIGRQDDCEVCVKDEYVSRYHAEVSFQDGHWSVTDLGSANGLYVNGRRVPEVKVGQSVAIRLGIKGPEILLQIEPTGVQPKPILPQRGSGIGPGIPVRNRQVRKQSSDSRSGRASI